ncbi:hypothetical protein AVEN_37469-1 [Araneus ventricosus]|uniref:Uncharacterized protein n=1 Tax=Araneus ventricosus TaxID=182803 RepID=A0A4Y2FDW7_ARAVE|nr:hypothetical protein AVEN_37469-1 [Araneus ventricosus]
MSLVGQIHIKSEIVKEKRTVEQLRAVEDLLSRSKWNYKLGREHTEAFTLKRSCSRRSLVMFFTGAVHTGAANLCNRFSSRASHPSPMKQLRFRRQIVAWSHSNE